MIDLPSPDPLVALSDIAEIELFILKRLKEVTLGDHASVFKGPGFDFVGVREWEPGDRLSSVDWAQSTLTNFSPLIVREFEQDSNATVVAGADASLSTRCGAAGAVVGVTIARAVATLGLSAALFQDPFGLITFDERFRPLGAARPRIGRPHVLYCLDLYQSRVATERAAVEGALADAIAAQLRRTSLVSVISDFLFDRAPDLLRQLAKVNASHDVFLVMADARTAYLLPDMIDGWIQTFDIETGSTRIMSRREVARLAARVDEWQDRVERLAKDEGLDLVRVGFDRWEMETALAAFVGERRLRKIQRHR
jgi:uncharacterized protein (DUF58 family)